MRSVNVSERFFKNRHWFAKVCVKTAYWNFNIFKFYNIEYGKHDMAMLRIEQVFYTGTGLELT